MFSMNPPIQPRICRVCGGIHKRLYEAYRCHTSVPMTQAFSIDDWFYPTPTVDELERQWKLEPKQ